MKLLDVIRRFLSRAESPQKAQKKQALLQSDIRFSALIQSIYADMISANKSLEGVGIKYIEQFFYKELSEEVGAALSRKIDQIGNLLVEGDKTESLALLDDLKSEIEKTTDGASSLIHYRPKMVSFEIPSTNENEVNLKTIDVPLFAIAPLHALQIKDVTFRSKVQTVKRSGDDVYVKFLPSNTQRPLWSFNKSPPLEHPEISFSIGSTQTNGEIEDLISHYENVLLSNRESKLQIEKRKNQT